MSIFNWKRAVNSKKPYTISYCKYSESIRQMPQNYLIAHYENCKWICDPDLAASMELVLKTQAALMEFDNKYNPNGLEVIEVISKQKIPI